ncbi:hypothetical protein [Methanosarcina barkeri]|uniref:hypothetical protein n=1 Tax=Methanosarcina barkeri TaxID=2208 RepID=UPI000A7F8D63|nr:hypothetical protein [Methanosarcina barkeri]
MSEIANSIPNRFLDIVVTGNDQTESELVIVKSLLTETLKICTVKLKIHQGYQTFKRV